MPAAPLPGTANFLLGADPTAWQIDLPTYAEVRYLGLYPGIDLSYGSADGRLKSTFTVAPGADPTRIRWHYRQARNVQLDAAGNLIVTSPVTTGPVSDPPAGRLNNVPPSAPALTLPATAVVTLTERAPIAWQDVAGERRTVAVRFTVDAQQRVSFEIGAYNPALPLTIDPFVDWEWFDDETPASPDSIVTDAYDNVYVAGSTGIAGNGEDVFVKKWDAAGVLRSTTFLGSTGNDQARGLGILGDELIIAGVTNSATFLPVPYTLPLAPVDTTFAGSTEAFVLRLNSAGNELRFSSYLGGSAQDSLADLALDNQGKLYLVGETNSERTTLPCQADATNVAADPNGTMTDALLVGLSFTDTGATLETCLLFGGSQNDGAKSVAVDGQRRVTIAGATSSSNFPTNSGPQLSAGGGNDGFAVQFNLAGASPARVYSTYIGGPKADSASGVAVDSTGAAVVVGSTLSDTGFPVKNAIQANLQGSQDMFVAKLPPDGGTAFVFATYLGGTAFERGNDVLVDSAGRITVTGTSQSASYPYRFPNPVSGRCIGNYFNAVLTQYTPDGQDYVYSTAFNGYGEGVALTSNSEDQGYLTGLVNGGTFVLKLDGPQLPLDLSRVPETCPCAGAQFNKTNPVNTLSGNFWTTVTDLRVDTPGPELVWQRTYSSQAVGDSYQTRLSPGWFHSYGETVLTTGGLRIISAKGNVLRYEGGRFAGTFVASPGVYGSLRKVGNDYYQTLRDQTVRKFTGLDIGLGVVSKWRLTESTDPQGRKLLFNYSDNTATARLTSIVDANDPSRAITLEYYPDSVNQGRVWKVRAGGRNVEYTYANNQLTSVRDVMQRETRYEYHSGTQRIATIISPEGTEAIQYDTNNPVRVAQQTLPSGELRQFAYKFSPATTTTITTTRGLERQVEQFVYGPNNALQAYRVFPGPVSQGGGQTLRSGRFEEAIGPGVVRDGNNNLTFTTFNQQGLPIAQRDAGGQRSTRTYDARNNLLTETDALGVTTAYTYDTYQGQPTNNIKTIITGITTTSSLRATTIYTYTYSGSEVLLSAMRSPDGVVTSYIYPTTGSAAQKRLPGEIVVGANSATPLRTAYGYDAYGRVVTTTIGLGIPALERLDIISYRLDNTISQTIQNYKDGQYDPARPDEDLITRYQYDTAGRQVVVTDPSGRNTVTHYDQHNRINWTARNVIPLASDDQGQVITPTFNSTVPDRNVLTFYGYDGLGRTTLVTETGILTGSFTLATRQFSETAERVTRTQYDSQSRPITVTLNFKPEQPSTADTNVNLYTRYDGAGNVITQTDALGRRFYTQYDKLNRPITVTLNFEDGNPLTGSDDADIVQVTQYDALGRVKQTIDNYVDGVFAATEAITDRITLYEYDTLSRVVTTTVNFAPGQTDPSLNRVSVMRYDPTTTRLQGQRDSLGRWTSVRYDALGRVTHTTANCRDGAGNPVATGCATYSPAARDRNVTTLTNYDLLGRTANTYQNYVDGAYNSSATDEDVRTHTVYDGVGRVVTSVANFEDGVYSSTASDRDIITTTRYDGLGRAIQLVDAINAATQTGYNGLDQTVALTDTLGRVTRQGYDGTGAQRWRLTPDGRLTLFQLDGLGRVVATIQNYQDGTSTAAEPDRDLITRAVYDAAGRRLRAVDPLGRITAFTYDNRDRLTMVTDNVVETGCVQSDTDCNVQTQYGYDRADNRVRMIDGRGVTAQQATYDAAHQQRTWVDGLGRTTIYSYDALGRQTEQQDPRGPANSVTYSYDGRDRLTTTTASNLGTLAQNYDALGRRVSLSDGTGTTSFVFDALGRIISVTAPDSGMVGYSYTPRGERETLIYPDLTQLTYRYKADGQLWRVEQGATLLAEYSYDPAGRLNTLTRANGATTTYSYNGVDRLKQLETQVQGQVVSQFSYQLDRLGVRRVVTETLSLATSLTGSGLPMASDRAARPLAYRSPLRDAEQTAATPEQHASVLSGSSTTRVISYDYDRLNRLTSAIESGATSNSYGYGYDLAGNRIRATANGVTTSRTYNAANQVDGWSYDATGNLLNDGTTTYGYDALSRLTSQGGASLTYNGDGTLVARSVGATTTRYVQDFAVPLSQVLNDGTANYLVYSPGERLAISPSGTRTWYIADALGSVRQTLDDTGTPLATANYDPWGVPQGGQIAPFGFTGELQDPSGMVYLRARWYNASHGTFTSVDPFSGFSEQPYSLHPYAYAYSDPVRYTDPTGKNPLYCAAIAFIDSPVPGPADLAAGVCLLIVGSVTISVSVSTWLGLQSADDILNGCLPVNDNTNRNTNPPYISDTGGNTAPNPPAPTPPSGNQQDHYEDLGKEWRDNGTRGSFRQHEAELASRLERVVGRLERFNPRTHPTNKYGDWIDSKGLSYDGVGPVNANYFNLQSFTNQINRHLLKQGVDYTVVDLTGLNATQSGQVQTFINSLSQAQRAQIIILGP